MTSTLWSLVEFAGRPLDRDERDAVVGDSLEAGDSAWQALFGVLGLVLRRQISLWKSWRPWLAVFVFGVPSTVLLMYVSVSVTCTFDRLMGFQISHWAPTGHEGFALLLCHIFLLIAWSWTSGFTLGSLSPRTLWLNATLGLFLALYFANHFRHFGSASIANLSPFLFLVPAIWGVRQGVRTVRLRRGLAFLLAATITVLMISAWTNSALWVLNWLLLCPAWYLVATARRSDSRRIRSGSGTVDTP
ncbi:MAG: hypothetical protein QOK38_3883 [Acidobacteriaceae bacterium]|jgi:hypothetical protein|nr:hypothetical protein [Acidobacteriaceae bacterium]